MCFNFTIFFLYVTLFCRQLETTLKNASHSISLIAGVYGDDDEEEDDTKVSPPKVRRTGVHVKVQKPASKQLKPLLKEIPGIFKETDEDDEDEQQNNDQVHEEKDVPKKTRRRWGNVAICIFKQNIFVLFHFQLKMDV